jgi:hypothetical protein
MEREFTEYENDEGAKVYAHRVTPDTEGPVMLVGGTRREVKRGDVLVQSQNSNMYDVYSGRQFDEMFPRRTDGEEDSTTGQFNPSDYTAREVKEYLESVRETDEDEYDRVVEAEKNDRNRASAFPK